MKDVVIADTVRIDFEMSSSGAAIVTGECQGIVETGTVSFLELCNVGKC